MVERQIIYGIRTRGSAENKDRGAEQEDPLMQQKSRSELLLAFAEKYARDVKDPIHSWEIDVLLYDENGLPK